MYPCSGHDKKLMSFMDTRGQATVVHNLSKIRYRNLCVLMNQQSVSECSVHPVSLVKGRICRKVRSRWKTAIAVQFLMQNKVIIEKNYLDFLNSNRSGKWKAIRWSGYKFVSLFYYYIYDIENRIFPLLASKHKNILGEDWASIQLACPEWHTCSTIVINGGVGEWVGQELYAHYLVVWSVLLPSKSCIQEQFPLSGLADDTGVNDVRPLQHRCRPLGILCFWLSPILWRVQSWWVPWERFERPCRIASATWGACLSCCIDSRAPSIFSLN